MCNLYSIKTPHQEHVVAALAGLAQTRKRCLVPANSFAEYAPEPNPRPLKSHCGVGNEGLRRERSKPEYSPRGDQSTLIGHIYCPLKTCINLQSSVSGLGLYVSARWPCDLGRSNVFTDQDGATQCASRSLSRCWG